MPNITAEFAGSHFDSVLEDARHDPVFISRGGEHVAVVLSWDAFRRVMTRNQSPGVRPAIEERLPEMMQRYGDLFRDLSKLD